MKDLCDTATKHTLNNALGSCFSDLTLQYDAARVAEVKSTTFEVELGSTFTKHLLTLSEMVSVKDDGPAKLYGAGKTCGKLVYKLA